jgi:adenylate cyclase
MAVEIERKFLTVSEAWHAGAIPTPVKQGYIFANEHKSVRVRTMGDLGFLTVKSRRQDSGTNEFEYEIPLDDALELLEVACEQPVIEKLRYSLTDKGHDWVVDVFKGANSGLVLAEVELKAADEHVDLPDWVGEEVTADSRYYNASLYRNPFHNWHQA